MSSADTFDIMLAASGAFAPDGQPLSAFIKEIKYDEFYGGWVCIDLNLRFTRVLYRRMSFSWDNNVSSSRNVNAEVLIQKKGSCFEIVYLELPLLAWQADLSRGQRQRPQSPYLPLKYLPFVFKQIEQLERRLQNEQLPGEAECSFT